MKLFLFLAFTLIPSLAFSHGGGLDKSGGHNYRENGGYHCHREPCISQHQKSNKAVSEAVNERRSFSYVYNRKDWKHWSDLDNDCMNTRHEILKIQADGLIRLSPDGCYVSSGVWSDPFSGMQLTRASDLDVDHVVPLKWASDHGGGVWSKTQKESFANDPINLLAVDDGLNQAKGAKGPSKWMPPNQAFRCEYLSLWENVLSKYPTLTMSSKENRIFVLQLKACNS